MPKEQGHFGERVARSSSKNAKDRSNSATLRASQSGSHREQSGSHQEQMGRAGLTNRLLRCDSEKDSEKDSGYSEAGSDSVHTDVDDQRSSVSEPHRQSSSSASAAPLGLSPYKDMAPVYVLKNVMVKPSRPEPLLHSPLAWGGAWHKGPTQVLLIQQSAIPPPAPPAPAPPKTHPKKTAGRSSSYLPILNSYPRIAPHPRKDGHEGKGSARAAAAKESGGEGQSQSKRVCTEEEKREAVSTTTHLATQKDVRAHSYSQQKDVRAHSYSQQKEVRAHLHHPQQKEVRAHLHHPQQKEHKSRSSAHGRHSHSSSSDNISSPSVSSSQTPSPPCSSDSASSSSPSSSSPSSSAAHSPYRPAPDSTSARQRRFLNTAEILNQSGLLAITLRTKELLKQNAATEREIAQLRQHTQYLCQAARAGAGGEGLEKLVQAMAESGSYPELDLPQLQALADPKEEDGNAGADSLPRVLSLHGIDDGTAPPSPLFAPSPETAAPEQALDALPLEVGDRDLSRVPLLPESSTHDFLL